MTFYGSLSTAPLKQKGTTMAEERADAINSRCESADGDEPDQVVEKVAFSPGWSKTSGCKAREILRNEAYGSVRRNDEG